MVMNWNIYSFIDFPHAVPAAAWIIHHCMLYLWGFYGNNHPCSFMYYNHNV